MWQKPIRRCVGDSGVQGRQGRQEYEEHQERALHTKNENKDNVVSCISKKRNALNGEV